MPETKCLEDKWLEDKKEKDEWVLDHQTKGLNGLWTSELDIVSGQSNKRPNSRRQTSKGQNGRGRSGNIPLGLRFRWIHLFRS